MRVGLIFLFAGLGLAQTADQAKEILKRVAEEASVFARLAPNLVGEETLVQLSLKKKGRFRPRIGAAALRPPDFEYQSRQIVSEYGYGTYKDSPALHEFRQVVSVDGQPVQSKDKARRTLVMGIRSRDDNDRHRLLKDFERHGLQGAATDFGQILLLFTFDKLQDYRFSAGGEKLLGADRMIVIRYRSLPGKGSLVVFDDKEAFHLEVSGELWVRSDDHLPLRITMQSVRTQHGAAARTEASVEYAPSAHAVVTPVSALHREIVNNLVTMENQFRYKPFQRYGSESELKFEVQPNN